LVSGREIVALRTAYRQAGRERTCGLARTRNVLPTCLPAASLDAERRCATTSAAAWSVELRVPIRRSAQLTPFITKWRSSRAALSMRASNSRNCASEATLSWPASEAISVKAARCDEFTRGARPFARLVPRERRPDE
jgi:hypothetical protein